MSSSKLAIETGRYVNIEREDRFFNICNLETIGDEYHLIFECKNERIVDLRRKCLPESYMSNSSRNKLIVSLKFKFKHILFKRKRIGLAKTP